MSVLYGVLIGLALGLTGGGGSIFAVPLLVYGLDVAPQEAVAISLLVVAATSAVGALESAWRSALDGRAGLVFAITGMVFAPVGVGLGNLISPVVIVIAFACLMLFVAIRMLYKAWGTSPGQPQTQTTTHQTISHAFCRYGCDGKLQLNGPCVACLCGAGSLVGVLSGFFGVGGGFLIVPALMLVTRMKIHTAVATSLLIITLIGISGVASAFISGRPIDLTITGLFTVGGALGMVAGRALADYLAGRSLQTIFALAMLGIAVFMLVEKLVL